MQVLQELIELAPVLVPFVHYQLTNWKMDHEALKGKISKKDLQKKWWEVHDIVSSPYNKVFNLYISQTDGNETHEHIHKKKGQFNFTLNFLDMFLTHNFYSTFISRWLHNLWFKILVSCSFLYCPNISSLNWKCFPCCLFAFRFL